MIDEEVLAAARRVLDLCRRRKLKVATAESCTGGLVSAALTAIAGSSDVVDRGFVTYSNAAKHTVLGVSDKLLKAEGAVNQSVAEAMARGALARSDADIVAAITGIAGPTGGSRDKPVGLVHFAAASRSGALTHQEIRFGDLGRHEVRRRSVLAALSMLAALAAD